MQQSDIDESLNTFCMETEQEIMLDCDSVDEDLSDTSENLSDSNSKEEILSASSLIDSVGTLSETDLKNEIWVPVQGYPKYQISNMGRFRNRYGISIGNLNPKGYLSTLLSNHKHPDPKARKKHFTIHRLVATHFLDNPQNKKTVNHLGKTTDNRHYMLERATQAENNLHAAKNLTTYHRVRVSQIDATTGAVVKIFNSYADAAAAGFSSGNISMCINGTRHTHKGFNWIYTDERTVVNDIPTIEDETWQPLFKSTHDDVKPFVDYAVSSKGRVLNIKSYKLLTIHKDGTIELRSKQLRKRFRVSRLMMQAFNIPNPENKEQVDHIDSDPMHNDLDNLRYATARENSLNPATREKVASRPNKSHVAVKVINVKDGSEQIFSNISLVVRHTHVDRHRIRKRIENGQAYQGYKFQKVEK